MILSNERGSALIITLMLLLILTAIGIYAISISTTEMSIALQSKTGTATLNATESGVHYAVDLVPNLVTNDNGILADQSRYSVSSWATGGMTLRPGFGANYRFADFMADSTGTAPLPFVGQRRVQAVVIFGPVPVGTMY
ncbi:PilX N-terminal domain-containing pilus assembly protein [Candidatus Deferrimicrobium sp.]|uniref:PilX N-terminal domain-containing pilus assembly protein n=1 Tax=Candidatus Deferrimicrobium sp. TaxID=3060586 RepID=UPI003C3E505F